MAGLHTGDVHVPLGTREATVAGSLGLGEACVGGRDVVLVVGCTAFVLLNGFELDVCSRLGNGAELIALVYDGEAGWLLGVFTAALRARISNCNRCTSAEI